MLKSISAVAQKSGFLRCNHLFSKVDSAKRKDFLDVFAQHKSAMKSDAKSCGKKLCMGNGSSVTSPDFGSPEKLKRDQKKMGSRPPLKTAKTQDSLTEIRENPKIRGRGSAVDKSLKPEKTGDVNIYDASVDYSGEIPPIVDEDSYMVVKHMAIILEQYTETIVRFSNDKEAEKKRLMNKQLYMEAKMTEFRKMVAEAVRKERQAARIDLEKIHKTAYFNDNEDYAEQLAGLCGFQSSVHGYCSNRFRKPMELLGLWLNEEKDDEESDEILSLPFKKRRYVGDYEVREILVCS